MLGMKLHKIPAFVMIAGLLLLVLGMAVAFTATVKAAEESGSVGLEGRISAPPPTTPAVISFPTNGAVIRDLPVTVTGICQDGLLVKLFKNNVFAGSAQCVNGGFSIQIDLFSGLNELVARVYDDLDQAGPDSNIVRVTFPSAGFNTGISGGNGPYAVSVDWGDGKPADIYSQPFAGAFNIEHVYDSPGIYNVVVRATDKDGNVAFLQLVAVANGPLSQTSADGEGGGGAGDIKETTKILWQPAAISIPLILSTFYLGRKYELFTLRKRLEQREEVR